MSGSDKHMMNGENIMLNILLVSMTKLQQQNNSGIETFQWKNIRF